MNILNTYKEFDINHFDINVDHYGAEMCDKGYSFGPTVREDYVLHFIVNGKGSFTINGKITALKEGDLFLLPKGQVTFYQADAEEPWTYLWVGFSGSKVESILHHTSLLDNYYCRSTTDSNVLNQLFQLMQFRDHQLNTVTELQLIAKLYKLLAFLIEEFPSTDSGDQTAQNYIKQTLKIIHTNYSKPLKVADIADKLNLNRSYLYKLFKEHTGYSIKDYIKQVRMEKSAHLLTNFELSVSDVSSAVGFTDSLSFSKVFKKHFGQSPSTYRKQAENQVN